MSNYDDAEYLRVLELDDETPNIHRVSRGPNAVAHLVERLIRESKTIDRKELWALESTEDHSSMSTGSEDGVKIGQEPSTGRLISRSEPKIQISELGVVCLTKTLVHQSFTTGISREFEVVSGRKTLKEHRKLQVEEVSLGCSGDLLITLQDIAAALFPYKSVMKFMNLELKFLVFHEILPHKLLITPGFPVSQEAFLNIERELKNSSSVMVSMVDDSRCALHIMEKTSALQIGLIVPPPRTPALSAVTPSCSNGSLEGQEYDVSRTISQQAVVLFLKLPIAEAIRCLVRRFGMETVRDAFRDLDEQTESSPFPNHSKKEVLPSSESSDSSQGSDVQIRNNIECDFDPLNTPILR